ncbi:PARP domain containing protein [Asbolus verrucosus]|uniref:Poly [ADP-ribose] polymerase n=1 Tax=Asbolus verrucosus TaxID=1661398 RepID=A0A482W9Y9_ASBVE|nr:PARP domain containing protein [Asbolus verrucosus]
MASGEDENTYLKKSKCDSRIKEKILQEPMATDWEGGNYNPYRLVTVEEGSDEYDVVENLFDETSRGLTITQVKRVENPYLLGQYLMKKEKMARKRLFVDERLLFHGTRESNVDGICRFNFDWRRNGQSTGHKFGQGVSFTPEVSYARHYTSGENVFFLVKVLVANSTIGNASSIIPPPDYDTTENVYGTVIVKYEDDDFYPQYLIYA